MSFAFSFSNICTWFLGGAKIKYKFGISENAQKVFKIDTCQRFWEALCAIG